ncbi:MAG: hypothetical protein IKR13_03455 [Victivallales bacterium]|nr:hypothetical protein [Victivallales bacterium]
MEFLDNALRCPAGDGMMSPANIFATLDGRFLHRFDSALAANPLHIEFNNLGGNSL